MRVLKVSLGFSGYDGFKEFRVSGVLSGHGLEFFGGDPTTLIGNLIEKPWPFNPNPWASNQSKSLM